MQNIRCVIVDDEELARVLLENYVSRVPFLELMGQCKNPLEAMTLLHQQPVDVLFLDIQMPELTGIDFLKTLTHKPLTVLTTAYPDYALEGYNLDVVDYLLKPFAFERFLQAVNKVAERLGQREQSAPPVGANSPVTTIKNYISVKSEHKIYRLALDQILYIESMREYVAFHTPTGRILSLDSLKNLETALPPEQFIRVHKSYMVALSQIKSLEGNQLYVGKEALPVGASFREAVLKRVFG